MSYDLGVICVRCPAVLLRRFPDGTLHMSRTYVNRQGRHPASGLPWYGPSARSQSSFLRNRDQHLIEKTMKHGKWREEAWHGRAWFDCYGCDGGQVVEVAQ